MRLGLLLPLVTVGAAAAVVIADSAVSSGSDVQRPSGVGSASRGLAAPSGLAAPPKPAFSIPTPQPLADEARAVWAPVARAAQVYRHPRSSSAVVGSVATMTPEGTRNIVAVLGSRTVGGAVWVRVRIASLPNGRTGWIRRPALAGYTTVATHLVIDRETRTATLLADGRVVLVVPVGIGTAATPTPAGEFYVRNRLTSYASPAYGPLAFGTSARSAVLTDWPAGGFIGIHGTDRPDLIPGAISHGCIRLRNADLLRLADRLEIGTPVTVQ